MKRKKVINTISIVLITILLCIATLEISYRFQWFDFYKAELKSLNTREILHSNKKKILVCGDSYTASPASYITTLRTNMPEHAVINAAVPGTGILQHSIYMPGRIHRFEPDIFVYQFYVGNDLFDISHPISSNISFTRKTYWWMSDRLLCIPYLNFRFAGVRYNYYDDAGGNERPKENGSIFSVNTYSKREKLNYRAEPGLIENTLFLEKGREKDWKVFERKFRKMVKGLKPGTKKIFLLLPHPSQISDMEFNNHIQLGAQFDNPLYRIQPQDYPLYIRINELCQELGFTVVDPLDVFRSMSVTDPVYYPNDPHLNDHGQRLLGDFLLNHIKYLMAHS